MLEQEYNFYYVPADSKMNCSTEEIQFKSKPSQFVFNWKKSKINDIAASKTVTLHNEEQN